MNDMIIPNYLEKSREECLKCGDRVVLKIPMTKVRTWNFGKARAHYEKQAH